VRPHELADGRRFRTLTVLNLFTREYLELAVGRSLTGQDVARAVERLRFDRGLPQRIYRDNGTEFVSAAMDLWAYTNGVILDFSRRQRYFWRNNGCMSDGTRSTADSGSRLRTTNTFMVFVLLLLLGQVAWQQMRISGLNADLDQSKRDLVSRVEQLATDKLRSHREEMVAAVAFVDDLYRSADGLQRPGGLYLPDTHRVDAEAIGTWILDVYMQARITGKSDAEARQSIVGAVKGSDEWRRKHPK